jgi:hypothetical protein
VPANPEVPSEETTVSPEKPTDTAVPEHPTETGLPGLPAHPTGGAPYPTLNGTAPHVPGSTGFLTATRPSGAVPSGTAPAGADPTEGLPTFVLPSAVPADETAVPLPSAPAGETSVSPEAPPPAETSAYGPGYGYGSKKRSFFGLF